MMADALELIARLSPKTIRFDGGGGGFGGLTPADIAGAESWIKSPLGYPLLHLYCGNSDGDMRGKAIKALRDLQHAEWERQDRVERAMSYALRAATDAATAKRATATADRQALAQAQQAYERAKEAHWTGDLSAFPAIRLAVIGEVCDPAICLTCKGRKALTAGELVIECKDCEGSGRTYWSDTRRAQMVGKERSTFIRVWLPVYNWSLQVTSDAFHEAARQFGAGLGRRDG